MAIAPALEELASAYGDKLRIAEVNVEENLTTAAQFNIRSSPTLLLFKKGALIAQTIGALSKPPLRTISDGQFKDAAA